MARSSLQGARTDALLLLGRLCLAALFLQAGYAKLMGWPGIVHLLQRLHAPLPGPGGIVAIVCELGAGALIALGWETRIASALLIAFIAGATWLAHRFWLMHGHAAFEAEINFYKNVALAGGFLLLIAAGPGRFSIDRG
jgi:putative oxidoreductase